MEHDGIKYDYSKSPPNHEPDIQISRCLSMRNGIPSLALRQRRTENKSHFANNKGSNVHEPS